MDVILANQRGEVTETTIAKVAMLLKGRWVILGASVSSIQNRRLHHQAASASGLVRVILV